MSVRSRTRTLLAAGASALALAGVIVVGYPGPRNMALDCQPGATYCTAILEPPNSQCAALHSRVDPGGVPGRVLRALVEMQERDVVYEWTAHVRDGAPAACWVEVRLSAWLVPGPDGGTRVDGQAPGWRDVIDAADVSSIVKDGRVSARPAYALRGGCRAHVYAGEDPCGSSQDVDSGTDDPQEGTP